MLIRRSAPHPRSRKTPRGGRKMAKMILMISLQVKAILKMRVLKAMSVSIPKALKRLS